MRAEELPDQGRVQGFYDCASPPKLGFQIKDQLFEFHESTIAYHTPDSDDSTWPGKRSAGAGAPTLPARFSAGPRIFDELSSLSGDMLQRSSALRQEVRRQDAQECLSSVRSQLVTRAAEAHRLTGSPHVRSSATPPWRLGAARCGSLGMSLARTT